MIHAFQQVDLRKAKYARANLGEAKVVEYVEITTKKTSSNKTTTTKMTKR